MIFTPFRTSATSRRAAAALLLAITLTLTCAAPSQAWTVSGRPTADSADRPTPDGSRFLHFLLVIFGFAGGVMDPNGNQ